VRVHVEPPRSPLGHWPRAATPQHRLVAKDIVCAPLSRGGRSSLSRTSR
jgi:hypothetical protein